MLHLWRLLHVQIARDLNLASIVDFQRNEVLPLLTRAVGHRLRDDERVHLVTDDVIEVAELVGVDDGRHELLHLFRRQVVGVSDVKVMWRVGDLDGDLDKRQH